MIKIETCDRCDFFENKREAKVFVEYLIKANIQALVYIGNEVFNVDSQRSKSYFGIKRK